MKPSAAWIVFAALFLSAGLILSGSTMWQGDCVAAAGRCPVASDGSGYPCASPGAACKVGWSAGKCKTESSTVWGCTCECR